MKRLILLNVVFIYLGYVSLFAFHIDGEHTANYADQQKHMLIDSADKFFEPDVLLPFSNEFVTTNPYNLMRAAQDTLNFVRKNKTSSKCLIVPPHLSHILNVKKVEKTLEYIISIIKQDMSSGKFRVLNPEFLNENFHFIKWNADRQSALNNGINLPYGGMIRLTNYAIFSVPGSYTKTNQCCCPLYQILDIHIAKKYSKQQVLSGILNHPSNRGKARPIVWLSRSDFEDALMQGTVIVRMPDGKDKIFMANQNNGIDYDKNNKDPWTQKRFWYFKEDRCSKWSIEQFKKHLTCRQNVVFAGDIFNMGLGKIIALKHINPFTQKPEIRLGVVADTGGAFVKNLYQLDFFAGIFQCRQDFVNHIKHLPIRTEAYILYR